MQDLIKETLEKQLQILSERSIRERGEILPDLTRVMIEIAKYLDSEPTATLKDIIGEEVANQLEEHQRRFLNELANLKPPSKEFFQELHELIGGLEPTQH